MTLYKGTQLIAGSVPNSANQSLSNLNNTGQAVIDGKVSKSGDTMTGALTVSMNGTPLVCKNTNYTFGTNPSSDTYTAVLQGLDNSGQSMMGVSNTYMSNGAHYARIYSTKDTNNNDWAYTDVGFNNNGNKILKTNGQLFIAPSDSADQLHLIYGNYGFIVRNDGNTTWFMLTNSGDPYGSYNSLRPFYINNSTGTPYFANTPCVDGQWIDSNQSMFSSAPSLSASTDLEYRITLPNDGHIYEVLLRGRIQTGSTSGNYAYLQGRGNQDSFSRFACGARTRANSNTLAVGMLFVTASYVASGSKNLTINRSTNFTGATLEVLETVAYRRIGSNS